MAAFAVQRRVRTAFAVLISIPFVVPFLFLISTAVRSREDYVQSPGGLPSSFTWEHIATAWTQAHLGRALINTLIVCAVACLVCASVAVAGAYWFRIRDGKWIGAGRLLLAAGYTIPMVTWLIPVFVIAAQVGWTGNLFIAGVVGGASTLPFVFYLVHTFMRQALTNDIIEASTLDGASELKAFMWIGIPMALPALAAGLALTFVWTFGDLLVAATLLQSKPSAYTITLAATTLTTREDINLQGQAGAALVSLLPTLVVFAFAQRALKQGFGAGSDK